MDQQSFILKDGRKMEFTEGGDIASNILILTFHGLFSIGDSSAQSTKFQELGIHCISPTLPGWAKSSPWPQNKPIKEYANDVNELLIHLFKDLKDFTIYTFGGSYGTAFAQIVTGNLDYVRGMLICGCFSPFKINKAYAKGMSWTSWIGVGPLAYYLPSFIRILAWLLKRKILTIKGANAIMNKAMQLSEVEVEQSKAWALRTGKLLREVKAKMTHDMILSMKYSQEGYCQVPSVLHADWGFYPQEISEKKIMIVGAKNDTTAHYSMQEWLANAYNVQLKTVDGGHISHLFNIDLYFDEYFEDLR